MEKAIDFLDVILHLTLNPYEADWRKVGQAIFFFIERTGDAEFFCDFVLLSGHLYPNVGLMDGVAIHVYLHLRLEEIAIGFITHGLSFDPILMFDLIYLQDLIQFFKGDLIHFL